MIKLSTKTKLQRATKAEVIAFALKLERENEILKKCDESDLAKYLKQNGYYDVNHQLRAKEDNKRYYIAGIEYLLRQGNGTGDIIKINKRQLEENFERI